jgi:hypothetical protein
VTFLGDGLLWNVIANTSAMTSNNSIVYLSSQTTITTNS